MAEGAKPRGVFIVLEGPDGAGKSTQARRLVEALRACAHEVVAVREPGGTPLGERLRALLLEERLRMGVRSELFVLQAARAALCEQVVEPALGRGAIVVADRFYPSSVVYQALAPARLGVAGALDPQAVIEQSLLASGGLLPDLTIVLALGLERARARLAAARGAAAGEADRFEGRSDAFLRAVCESYREYPRHAPEPVAVIDAERGEEAVFASVCARLRERLQLVWAGAASGLPACEGGDCDRAAAGVGCAAEDLS